MAMITATIEPITDMPPFAAHAIGIIPGDFVNLLIPSGKRKPIRKPSGKIKATTAIVLVTSVNGRRIWNIDELAMIQMA